ncbi:MAG: peptidoglycan-binding domain-containing protein [Planctomycetota bacterium]
MSTIPSSSTGSVQPTQPTAPAAATTTPPAAPAPAGLSLAGRFAGIPAFEEVVSGQQTMTMGEQGDHVKVLEEVLEALGHKLPGLANPDNKFTRATQNMVARFQRTQGLTQTGELDGTTLAALDKAYLDTLGVVDPLAGQTFMSSATFAGSGSTGWARDNMEIEAAMALKGVSGKEIVELMRAERGGRTTFQRLRRSSDSEAFTLSYGVDRMPWDRRSHNLREDNPYMWLSVESGRYEPDEETGELELSVGTDIMDDIYYDTEDFTLLDNDMSIRARVRWDNPEEVRRLLIAAKFGSEVNEFGLKSAAKVDVRRDRPDETAMKNLDESVRAGKDSWGGGPATPLREAHARLTTLDVLPDIGPHENVLKLEPKAYIRSTRSRYHLNQARIDEVKGLHELGASHLTSIKGTIEQARTAGTIPANREDDVAEFEAMAAGALDGSIVAEQAREALLAIDPQMDVNADTVKALFPGTAPQPTTFQELEKQRVVADALSEVYHDLGDDLGDIRRGITDSEDQSLEDHADMFQLWQKSANPGELAEITTFDKFKEIHGGMLEKPDAELEKDLAAFNEYGEAQRAADNDDFEDFETLDLQQFKDLGPQLANETLRIWSRQLEAAGSAGQGLWFDKAREFYVPDSDRAWGNFLIDTMDYTEMVTPEAWNSIPEAERKVDTPLPADKVFNAMLVNEVQIELGQEEPYVERMTELKTSIDTDRGSLFMKWADSVSHPGLGQTPDADAYRAVLDGIKALPEAEREVTLTTLNDFLEAQGSALTPLTDADLTGLDTALLTTEARDQDVSTEPTHETNLAGAEMVWKAQTDLLTQLAATKERRVMRTLDRAGAPSSAEWGESEASKGDTALTMLKDGQP